MKNTVVFAVLTVLCALFSVIGLKLLAILCAAALGVCAILNNRRLGEKCETDPLTRLPNRACFERLATEYYGKFRHVGVIFWDVDNLKSVNDTRGHLEGDAALRKMADSLIAVCGEGCRIFRFGGDEFLLIAENGTGGLLSAICERWRSRTEVCAAFGCACGSGGELRELVRRADRNMYESK